MYLKKYTLFITFFLLFSLLTLLILIRVFISSPKLEEYIYKSFKNKYSIIYFGDSVLKSNHKKNQNIHKQMPKTEKSVKIFSRCKTRGF